MSAAFTAPGNATIGPGNTDVAWSKQQAAGRIICHKISVSCSAFSFRCKLSLPHYITEASAAHAFRCGRARPRAMSVAAMSSSVSRTGVIARPSSCCTRLLLMDGCGSPASPSSNAYSGKRSCR